MSLAYLRALAVDSTRVGTLWWSSRDLGGRGPGWTYLVLDRRSGEEIRRDEAAELIMGNATAGNDDVLLEWEPGDFECYGESELQLYEDFGARQPFGQGRVVEDLYGLPTQKWLALGETTVIEAGEWVQRCIFPSPPHIWYRVHLRDGSGTVLQPENWWMYGLTWIGGLVERNGRGLLILDGDNGMLTPDGEDTHCCESHAGPCLLEFGPDAQLLRTECLADGLEFGPAETTLVAGRTSVLVGWVEGETMDSPWRVRALRLDDGEPTEVLGDFRPTWSALGRGWGGGYWAWTAAGDGFAVVAELGGENAGKRGLVLLDETGATVQEVVVDALPPPIGLPGTTLLVGGGHYGITSSGDCLDLAWMVVDMSDDSEPGDPTWIWLQSYCCQQ